jgi:hypothetical protein
MKLSRAQIIDILSEKYYKFLISLPYEDEAYMKGIHEGKGKFLSNLHIYLSTKDLPKKRNDKRYATDFITPKALEILKKGSTRGLEYEHLIPKKKYIQDVCEQKAKEGTLTIEFVKTLLDRYLWTATVTEQEHKLLSRRVMPADWDGKNITARYDAAGITLLKHDDVHY